MPPERLQKILSNAGLASRRSAETLLLEGRITVNGVPVTELGARADPEVDDILVDGVPVRRDRYRYFALNKPAGFVTTARDELGRPTVLDLVPIGDIVLHPVGRLDADSEGLLLLTTDGHLTRLLTHPSHEVEKEYLAGIDQPLSGQDLARLVRGIDSDGQRLRAASARVVEPPVEPDDGFPKEGRPGQATAIPQAWLLITLREGRNREIRRMLWALGRQVLTLRRLRIGPLHLGTLGSGAFRELEPAEVDALYRAGTLARREEPPEPRPDPRPARAPQRPQATGAPKRAPAPPAKQGAPPQVKRRPGTTAGNGIAPQAKRGPRRSQPQKASPPSSRPRSQPRRANG